MFELEPAPPFVQLAPSQLALESRKRRESLKRVGYKMRFEGDLIELSLLECRKREENTALVRRAFIQLLVMSYPSRLVFDLALLHPSLIIAKASFSNLTQAVLTAYAGKCHRDLKLLALPHPRKSPHAAVILTQQSTA